MDIRNTFKVAKEIAELARKYDEKDIGNNSQAEIHYKQFIGELDSLHSKLLQIGAYSREDILELSAVTTEPYGELPKHANVEVYYVYDDERLVLVCDTAFELHLIPKDIIRYDE